MTSMQRRTFRFACLATLVAAVFLIPNCGGEAEPPPAPTPDVVDPATTGGARGVVRFIGKAPTSRTITMGTNVCRDYAEPNDPSQGEAPNGLVKNAFVRIVKGLEGRVFARPTEDVVVDQKLCMFEPRVSGVRTGQWVSFKNSDPVAHNVNVKSGGRDVNRALAGKGSSFRWWFDADEAAIAMKCDVHPWMTGYMFVVGHPFFAVTGADGAFEIAGIPAGEYVLEAWVEPSEWKGKEPVRKDGARLAGRVQTAALKIEAGKTAEITFEF